MRQALVGSNGSKPGGFPALGEPDDVLESAVSSGGWASPLPRFSAVAGGWPTRGTARAGPIVMGHFRRVLRAVLELATTTPAAPVGYPRCVCRADGTCQLHQPTHQSASPLPVTASVVVRRPDRSGKTSSTLLYGHGWSANQTNNARAIPRARIPYQPCHGCTIRGRNGG